VTADIVGVTSFYFKF